MIAVTMEGKLFLKVFRLQMLRTIACSSSGLNCIYNIPDCYLHSEPCVHHRALLYCLTCDQAYNKLENVDFVGSVTAPIRVHPTAS